MINHNNKDSASAGQAGSNDVNLTGSIVFVTMIFLLIFGSTDLEKVTDSPGS